MNREDYCWPVVASLKTRTGERSLYCQTPNHPGCRNGRRHRQSDEMRNYAKSIFEGGRPRGGGGRHQTPDDLSSRERSRLVDAQERARALEAGLSSARGRDRPEQQSSRRREDGGLFGALAPPGWTGTRAHSAVSATASRWVTHLLACPGRAPRAFYAASQRVEASLIDVLENGEAAVATQPSALVFGLWFANYAYLENRGCNYT